MAELGEAVDSGESGASSSAIFSQYACRSSALRAKGKEHPGSIAEATSLSSVLLPPSNYPLLDALPKELVTSGMLSELQLEGVLYACSKHQQVLPSGQRAGFFIGDGAGVGKGRQIAGIILDNYIRGRKKHVWISISSDLRLDAERDLRDLGSHITVIANVQGLDKGTKAFGLSDDLKTGVLFLTYSSLISNVNGRSRLQQVLDWCGEGFDGCLVFDEAHKAKSYVPGKEAQSTKMSVAVLQLQDKLPQARVLYASATGVSEVGHMAYLTRMGLWGEGTAFKDFAQFLDSMKKRGVSFLEMLAMEMKAEGKYVARGLSFRDAEFSDLEAHLTPPQVAMYDGAVECWRAVRAHLHTAMSLTATPGQEVWRVFWSAQQRFFKLLCVSIKVPTVVSQAKEALANGFAVVIGLQTTGEAADASMGIERPGPVKGFVSTTREILRRFVTDHLPVHAHQPTEGKKGGAAGAASSHQQQPQQQPPGAPRVVPECLEMREELLAAVARQQLPPNFLDEILDHLGGPTQVAEMTGRKGRIVRRARPNGAQEFVYELRAAPDTIEMDSLNVVEKDLFMNGKRHVAIISDAASTGISLHASRTAKNQRRRMHITIELPWSADKAIQQLGRTHRSNQVTGPIYKLVSTRVGGEKRFAAAVARRLQSLGALTRGDRRAASGIDLSEQNYDSPLGRRSLRKMYDAIVSDASELPAGVAFAAVRKEQVKEQTGRFDMSDEEAEQLADMPDAFVRAQAILDLHQQLRTYVEIMGVIVGGGTGGGWKGDTVAEDLDAAGPRDGMGSAALGADKGGASGKHVGDVRVFLNRLLGLPLAQQNLLFAYFSATLVAEVAAAKKDGKYSEGLSDLNSNNITITGPPTVLWRDALSGLKTMRNDFQVDRGVSFESALEMLQREPSGSDSTFMRARRPQFGAYLVLLALQVPGARHRFNIIRPNTGPGFIDLERSELDQRYSAVDAPEDVQEEWTQAYDASLQHCMHGQGCQQGASCNVGKRLQTVTLLSGSVVRVWGTLEAVLGRHEHQLSRAERIMRVVRVELPSAQQEGSTPLTSPNSKKSRARAGATDSCIKAPPSQASEMIELSDGDEEEDTNTVAAPAARDASAPNNTAATPATQRTPAAPAASRAASQQLPSQTQQEGGSSAPPPSVNLPDHVVGVRYSAALLPEVVAALQLQAATQQQEQQQQGQVQALASVLGPAAMAAAASAGSSLAQAAAAAVRVGLGIGVQVTGGGALREEPPTPVDSKCKHKAFLAPKNILDFFARAPAPGAASHASQGSQGDGVVVAKSAGGFATQQQEGKGGRSSSGGGVGVAGVKKASTFSSQVLQNFLRAGNTSATGAGGAGAGAGKGGAGVKGSSSATPVQHKKGISKFFSPAQASPAAGLLNGTSHAVTATAVSAVVVDRAPAGVGAMQEEEEVIVIADSEDPQEEFACGGAGTLHHPAQMQPQEAGRVSGAGLTSGGGGGVSNGRGQSSARDSPEGLAGEEGEQGDVHMAVTAEEEKSAAPVTKKQRLAVQD